MFAEHGHAAIVTAMMAIIFLCAAYNLLGVSIWLAYLISFVECKQMENNDESESVRPPLSRAEFRA